MLLEGGHHPQDHVLPPMPGYNLYAHWQTSTVLLYIWRSLIREFLTHNTVTFFTLLHPCSGDDARRHTKNVVKQTIAGRGEEVFTASMRERRWRHRDLRWRLRRELHLLRQHVPLGRR